MTTYKQAPPPTLGYGDYLRFSRLIHDRYGLNFPENRRVDLEQGIRQAFVASTAHDLDDYYQLLLDPDHGTMHLQQLVNALTIGESHFFRDAGQFDALYKHILPEIIERRRSLRTLRIWSAGCAGGEEPYSIAILLRELLPDVESWAITILATDINTEALDRARKGLYSEWAFREEKAKQMRLRYFTPTGNRYELLPEVRRMVTFSQLNLADDAYPAFHTNTTFMDLVACRNVTIYFMPSTTRHVVQGFYDCLVDGGWLVVGHSEHSLTTYQQFQARSYPSTILYQRTGHPTVLPEDWDWLTPTPETAGAPSLRVPMLPPTALSTPSTKASTVPILEPEVRVKVDPLEHAQELLDYGHTEQARDALLEVTKQQPDSVQACALLGRAYANLSRWDEAERWCQQAIRLDNLALDAYYTLALVMQHQGRVDEAIQAMKKVVYLDRTAVLGHYGLADLYHNKELLPQALKSLDNARRLLNSYTDGDLVPGSGGVTVQRLQETIIKQQQQWRAEAMERV